MVETEDGLPGVTDLEPDDEDLDDEFEDDATDVGIDDADDEDVDADDDDDAGDEDADEDDDEAEGDAEGGDPEADLTCSSRKARSRPTTSRGSST
jgi:hypothetical protein